MQKTNTHPIPKKGHCLKCEQKQTSDLQILFNLYLFVFNTKTGILMLNLMPVQHSKNVEIGARKD